MFKPAVTSEQTLVQMELLQDEVLNRLDALNAQIEALLAVELTSVRGQSDALRGAAGST